MLERALYKLNFNTNNVENFTKTEAINRIESQQTKFPIYHVNVFKTGVYKTVSDFLQNVTDNESIVSVTFNDTKKMINACEKKANGKPGKKLKPNNFFALFDGRDWYLSTAFGLMKMWESDHRFYAEIFSAGVNKVETDLHLNNYKFNKYNPLCI